MSDVPVWLLDIDGVINACTLKPDPNVWPRDQWTQHRLLGFNILVAAPVVEFIRRVHGEGRAEIRWHTTWQEDAARLEDAFGLPHLPVQDAPEFYDQGTALKRDLWWKRPAAERVLRDEGRALIWTDDDATWDLGRRGADELRALGRLLLVCPNERTGLTPKHLRLIDEFLE